MKRSSEDREGSEESRRFPSEERKERENSENSEPSKRRKVTFDPVRLPAVSNVNDMKNRTLHYQASKLKQQFLYKNKRINELERELEKTRRRHEFDENLFINVFHAFSEIDLQIRRHTAAEHGEVKGVREVTTDIQTIRKMSEEECKKFLDTMKDNVKAVLTSYSSARNKRAREQKEMIDKFLKFQQDPEKEVEGINNEMLKKAKELAEKNEALQVEIGKTINEGRQIQRKYLNHNEKYENEKKRTEEMRIRMEEWKHSHNKMLNQAAKFENRLGCAVDEINQLKQSIATGLPVVSNDSPSGFMTEKKSDSPGSPCNEQTAKEMDTLRAERDEQMEIASRRLQELAEANKKIQTMSQEISKQAFSNQNQTGVTSEAILQSNEYKCLRRYYSGLLKEHEKILRENEDLLIEKERLREVYEMRGQQMEAEHAKVSREIVSNSDLHNTFYKIHHESEILRFEYEALREEYSKTVKQGEWDELKASLNSSRSIVVVQRNELLRLRETNKASKAEIVELKSQIRQFKEREERHLMVPMDEKDYSMSPEDIHKIRAEYEAVRREFRRLGAQEKAEKQKMIEKEVKQQMGEKWAELENLRKRNEQLVIDEQSISDELEEIGNAVEEEQERCAQLFTEKRDLEDRNLKMMNERMVQNQVLARMADKLSAMENKQGVEIQLQKMHEFEKKQLEESVGKVTDAIQYKAAELARANQAIESNRRTIVEVGSSRDELAHKCSRDDKQSDKLQSLFSEKAKELEEEKFTTKRLDEELEAMRLKYERARKNEAMGVSGQSATGDQVLEEANRQMKETLTCPSCKTRPKDCIMLKCYHLFCETCIKTMYESRQRKCPKCASPFGANDFHRVFI